MKFLNFSILRIGNISAGAVGTSAGPPTPQQTLAPINSAQQNKNKQKSPQRNANAGRGRGRAQHQKNQSAPPSPQTASPEKDTEVCDNSISYISLSHMITKHGHV